MESINIKIQNGSGEICVYINGADFYYDGPITEKEAVIRSIMRFYGMNPDYCLDGVSFDG